MNKSKIWSFLNKDLPGASSAKKEINNQVNNYHELGKLKSARGIAGSLIVFYLLVYMIDVLQGNQVWINWLLYAIIYIPLIIFIYKGKRLAMILAIIVWTIDRFYIFFQTQNWIGLLVWFIIFGALAKAWQIEVSRKKNN